MANQNGRLAFAAGRSGTRNQEGLRTLFSGRYEAEDQPGDYGRYNQADPGRRGGKPGWAGPDLPHEPWEKRPGLRSLRFIAARRVSRAIFWLKLAGVPAIAGKIATLDVFSSAAGGPLAGTDVSAADFQPGDQYRPFVVDLDSDRTSGPTWNTG